MFNTNGTDLCGLQWNNNITCYNATPGTIVNYTYITASPQGCLYSIGNKNKTVDDNYVEIICIENA